MIPPQPALEINELTKTYPISLFSRKRRMALDALTLSLAPGELFGYLGPNGSGKTTTLKILTGLIFPDSGRASVLGEPLSSRGWRRRVGYLPEHPYLYDYLTPTEYLDYAGRLFGMERGDRQARARELIEKVGLRGSAHVVMRRFSKGMVQRAALAQALLNDPELVLLDEPMSGLDPLGRRLVRNIILDLKERGKTVLFSTHILSDAETLCDRVAVLRAGKLMAVGRLDQILQLGVAHLEVLVSGPATAVERLPPGVRVHRAMAERIRLEVPEGTLGTVVASVERAGGRILAVLPSRQSLEDYFIQEMGQAQEGDVGPGGLSRILAVAANTFRETIREKVLYNLVFFALLMTLAGLLLKPLSIRQDEKIIKDIGLASLELFGTLIGLFMGVSLVGKEIERRSLYPLLAKPLSRDEFLLGKFAGLAFTLIVNVGVMTLGIYLTLWATRKTASLQLLQAVFAIYLGLLLVVAVALLFSTLTSSAPMALVCSVCLVVAGRFADVIRNMREVAPGVPGWITQVLYYALPNFRTFDLKARVVYAEPVSASDLGWIALYGGAYIVVVLGVALSVFRSKDLQ